MFLVFFHIFPTFNILLNVYKWIHEISENVIILKNNLAFILKIWHYFVWFTILINVPFVRNTPSLLKILLPFFVLLITDFFCLFNRPTQIYFLSYDTRLTQKRQTTSYQMSASCNKWIGGCKNWQKTEGDVTLTNNFLGGCVKKFSFRVTNF